MKIKFLILLLAISKISYCQISNYVNNEFNFIGYFNDIPIYQYNQLETNSIKNYTLFKSNMDKNGVIQFNTFKELNNQVLFYNDLLQVHVIYNIDNYLVSIKNDTLEYTNYIYNSIGYEIRNFKFGLVKEKNIIIFPFIQKQGTGLDQISYKNLNSSNDLIKLPLFGDHFFIDDKEEYLYFSSDMICDNFSTMPLNIYRVKIEDWNNPELILEEVNDWFLIPDKNLIYVRIHLGKEERNKRILYNIETKTYAKIDDMHAQRAVKYEGKYYYESRERNQPIKYFPIDIPIVFPFKDERIICGNNSENIISNLPNSQKPFTNTFITEELLYNSTNKELLELKKEELRKLRNAFYARQGYQFKLKDLQNFFGKFDWYHKMVERNKYLEISNEEVVISPKDKKRVELILEIENSK